jgi:hypothetical protein
MTFFWEVIVLVLLVLLYCHGTVRRRVDFCRSHWHCIHFSKRDPDPKLVRRVRSIRHPEFDPLDQIVPVVVPHLVDRSMLQLPVRSRWNDLDSYRVDTMKLVIGR